MQQLHKLFGNSATTPLSAAAANAIANTMWLLHGALRIVQLPHQCVSSVSDGN